MLAALQWCSSTEMCGVKSQEAFKPVAAGIPPGEHPEDCLASTGKSFLLGSGLGGGGICPWCCKKKESAT